MGINDIVTVNIVANTASPSRAGYGTPLILAYHTHYGDRVRSYTSTKGMVDDGFTVSEGAYLAAIAIKSQKPSVKRWKVGRRVGVPTQVCTLTCMSATAGDVYAFTVKGQSVSYTVPSTGSPTTTTVATAIQALITVSGVTVTRSTDVITLTASTAGAVFDVTGLDVCQLARLKDTTALPTPSLQTDLAAVAAADNAWYGLVLDSNSKAEIADAAVWVEANSKLFVPNTSDFECTDSAVTTDVMSSLKTSAYARTACLLSLGKKLSYSGAAWMGNRFPFDPGSDTWKFKTLAGVPYDALTDTQITNVKNKHGNTYTQTEDIAITAEGWSGGGEFIDVTRFIDWLTTQIQSSVFFLLVNNAKLPLTDNGIDTIVTAIKACLQQGVDVGGLVAGSYLVTAPALADISSLDKAARNIPSIAFTAELAQAIHSLTITGTVSV